MTESTNTASITARRAPGVTPATVCAAAALTLALLGGSSRAEEVGEVGVDWLGGDIKIEAIEDPKVQGITCHVSFFDRGLLDRVAQRRSLR